MITATVLLFFGESLPRLVNKGLPVVMLAVVVLSRSYMKKYWAPYKDKDGKDIAGKRIPLPNMEDYILAERRTEDLLMVMEYLEYSWLINFLAGFLGTLPSRPGTIRAPWNDL